MKQGSRKTSAMNLKATRIANVSDWLKRETPAQRRAFETASRHFDKHDSLDVHTLEGVFGQESQFGQKLGRRYGNGAEGYFQLRPRTAREMGLHIAAPNDERFDLDASSAAAAKYLKTLDTKFRSGKIAIAIDDPEERKKFDLAAYNAGGARVAKAQRLAQAAGEDPTQWKSVKKYLEDAGSADNGAKETRDYVEHISDYEKEFQKKSKARIDEKFRRELPVDPYPDGGHWITKDGRHILIKDIA